MTHFHLCSPTLSYMGIAALSNVLRTRSGIAGLYPSRLDRLDTLALFNTPIKYEEEEDWK